MTAPVDQSTITDLFQKLKSVGVTGSLSSTLLNPTAFSKLSSADKQRLVYYVQNHPEAESQWKTYSDPTMHLTNLTNGGPSKPPPNSNQNTYTGGAGSGGGGSGPGGLVLRNLDVGQSGGAGSTDYLNTQNTAPAPVPRQQAGGAGSTDYLNTGDTSFNDAGSGLGQGGDPSITGGLGNGAGLGGNGEGVTDPFNFGGLANLLRNLPGALSDKMATMPQYQKPLPDLNLPDAPNISVHRNDFTDQAGSMAKKAYQPTYDALDTGRQNSRDQYKVSDQIVAGLYDKLAADTATRQADTTKQYANQTAAADQRGKDTQAAISDSYSGAQDKQAATLKALGIEAAAPGSMQAGTDAAAFQGSQAATQAAAQGSALADQGAAQHDYQNNMASADISQGKADRSGLLNDLSSTLAGYDQQQQAVAGQQGQQALTIGQGLSDQDLNVQTTNAGFQQSAYQNAVQAAQAQYSAQVANQQYQNQQAQQSIGLQQQAAAAQAAAEQQKYDNDLNYAKVTGGLGIDAQNAASGRITADNGTVSANAARAKAQWDSDPRNPANASVTPKGSGDILASVANSLTLSGNIDPATATKAVSAVQSLYATMNAQGAGTASGLIQQAVLQANADAPGDAAVRNAYISAATAYANAVGLKDASPK